MHVFLAFVVLAGSALSLFLINLQTVPLALSAAAAAAVLVRTLIQKPAIWVPLTAALLVWIGALVVYAACSGRQNGRPFWSLWLLRWCWQSWQ